MIQLKIGDVVKVEYIDHFYTEDFPIEDKEEWKSAAAGVILTAYGKVIAMNDNYLFVESSSASGKVTNNTSHIEGIVRSCITSVRKYR